MIPVMLTGVTGRAGAASADRSAADLLRPGRPARWRWPAVAVMAGIAVLFYCAQRQARQMGLQSDGAAMELQAWAMIHGNVLLHGWYLSDVSFYTTELPEFALVEIVRGLNPDVARLCAALTYTVLVVLAAAVAYGARPSGRRTAVVRAGITVAVMLGPASAATTTLLNDPDHTGTAVPVLLALLILDRAPRRWWVPPALAVILGWALVGDSLVLLIGVAPLVAIGGARAFGLVALGRRPFSAAWYELSLAAAGVAAAVAGTALSRLITSSGGFTVAPDKTQYVVESAKIPGNASMTSENFLRLFSADFFGARLDGWLLLTAVHLVFAVLVAVALALALRGLRRDFPGVPDLDAVDLDAVVPQPVVPEPVGPVPVPGSGPVPAAFPIPAAFPVPSPAAARVRRPDRADLVAQLLAAGIVINLVAYGLLYPGSVGTAREIAPVFGLGGALAGRMLGGPLLRRRLEPLLALGAVAAIAALVAALLTVAPGQPASVGLARFLLAHHLRNGVAGYWNADSTTLVSGDRVRVRSIIERRGEGLTLYLWETDGGLLKSAANWANFVIASAPAAHPAAPVTPATVTPREAIATFGPPVRQYRYQGYVIMVWRKNLLSELRTSPATG